MRSFVCNENYGHCSYASNKCFSQIYKKLKYEWVLHILKVTLHNFPETGLKVSKTFKLPTFSFESIYLLLYVTQMIKIHRGHTKLLYNLNTSVSYPISVL